MTNWEITSFTVSSGFNAINSLLLLTTDLDTIDSLSSSSTMIFTKSILACEYISFYSLIGEENRNKFIVQYEEYIDDVVESLGKIGRNPRELHFFTEGGFCIKGK